MWDLDHRLSQSPSNPLTGDMRPKLPPILINTTATHSVKNIMSISIVTAATTREYIVYSPIMKKKKKRFATAVSATKKSTLEDQQRLTVQIWQEYTREITRKSEDRARQQCLKRYKTCSTRGISHDSHHAREVKRTVQPETYVREEVSHVGIIVDSSRVVVLVQRSRSKWGVGAKKIAKSSQVPAFLMKHRSSTAMAPNRSDTHTARDLFNTSRVHNRLS